MRTVELGEAHIPDERLDCMHMLILLVRTREALLLVRLVHLYGYVVSMYNITVNVNTTQRRQEAFVLWIIRSSRSLLHNTYSPSDRAYAIG